MLECLTGQRKTQAGYSIRGRGGIQVKFQQSSAVLAQSKAGPCIKRLTPGLA